MTILVTIVVITIGISAMCSLYEAILYSTRMGLLEAEAERDTRPGLAKRMIELKGNIGAPIAAILILNTLAHTVGATLAGAVATDIMDPTMVTVFSVVFTLGILFLSEIAPKTAGAVYWRKLWPTIIWPLKIMTAVLYPLILITEWLSGAITGGEPAVSVTEDEILGVTRLGARHGEISQWEALMVHNVIHLENKTAREVMTPRTVVFSLDESLTVSEALKEVAGKGFTRIPVYKDDRETITGYIMLHDLIDAVTEEAKNAPLSSIAQEVKYVPQAQNCLTVLTRFLRERMHLAIVEDEFGGVAGVVTLEDLLETVLGTEIVDEQDHAEDLREVALERKRERENGEKNKDEDKPDNDSVAPKPL